MIPLDIRKELIDKEKDSMSICQQCEMLSIARSTLYYTPSMAKDKDLEIMKELDRLYLEDPTRGTRRMSKELKKKGFQAGRYHVRTLMQIMRMKTVYCRPRTTVIDPAKYKYPYLLRNLGITRANHPESLRDCASIKVCGILAVKCFEIATFVCKILYTWLSTQNPIHLMNRN